jgi:hypothetical protein
VENALVGLAGAVEALRDESIDAASRGEAKPIRLAPEPIKRDAGNRARNSTERTAALVAALSGHRERKGVRREHVHGQHGLPLAGFSQFYVP